MSKPSVDRLNLQIDVSVADFAFGQCECSMSTPGEENLQDRGVGGAGGDGVTFPPKPSALPPQQKITHTNVVTFIIVRVISICIVLLST
eukprot:m.232456 g.232456  ORF g.232456 m.232456 type:complete len:89 (-) comp33623_c2_seq1:609-875(-)